MRQTKKKANYLFTRIIQLSNLLIRVSNNTQHPKTKEANNFLTWLTKKTSMITYRKKLKIVK